MFDGLKQALLSRMYSMGYGASNATPDVLQPKPDFAGALGALGNSMMGHRQGNLGAGIGSIGTIMDGQQQGGITGLIGGSGLGNGLGAFGNMMGRKPMSLQKAPMTSMAPNMPENPESSY
jgi:hypothetical protein